jgi:hypothetical protein
MHIASKVSVLASALVLAAACGGSSATGTTAGTGAKEGTSSGTTSGTGGGVSGMQACMDSVHAQCTLRDSCSTSGFLNDLTYGSEADCETQLLAPCVSALGAKGTGQTPTALENCAKSYSGEMCTDYFDDNPIGECIPPAGTLMAGSACGASAQCASTFCAIPLYQVCGKCAALPAPGAACQQQADCGRDLGCAKAEGAMATDMGVCAAFAASNAACLTGTTPCQAGFACVGDDPTSKTMGVCKQAGTATNATCDSTRKTEANCNADMGLVCIPTAKGSGVGTCQTITLAAPNAMCGDVGSAPITGFAECQAGGICKKMAATDTMGTCVAPVAVGTACDNDPTKGPPCLAPAKCVPTSSSTTAGTCTEPNAATCM